MQEVAILCEQVLHDAIVHLKVLHPVFGKPELLMPAMVELVRLRGLTTAG